MTSNADFREVIEQNTTDETIYYECPDEDPIASSDHQCDSECTAKQRQTEEPMASPPVVINCNDDVLIYPVESKPNFLVRFFRRMFRTD
jgi:hypothetical protein